ncbi:MAG TPA: Ig-like domain-containing protein, partial [Acidimicrobiales bacterium]|nr:Ig-like domain-containing protein [Acidimicrobiales bacterium]
QDVTLQGSTTVLLPTVDPATYGQTLLFVVSVAPAAGAGVPTGTVTVLNGTTPIGSATLAGGTAAVVTATLDTGCHSLTAAYAGDGNFAASTSSTVVEQIDAASTATALTASPSAASAGQRVTLTAAVTSPTGVPGGLVTFADGGSTLGTATLTDGSAELVTCFAHRGTQTLTAAYAGSGDFTASTSPPVTLQVGGGSGCGCGSTDAALRPAAGMIAAASRVDEGAPVAPAAFLASSSAPAPAPPALITVAATPATVDEGQSVTLTSVVFGNAGEPFPSGTVAFAEGAKVLGSAPTTQVGDTAYALASLRIGLAAGSYPAITAAYHPDASAATWYTSATSTGSAAVTVQKVAAATSLSVATSLNPAPKGKPLIITVTVNHPSSSLTPTGSITLTVGGAKPVAVAVDSLGQASLSVSSLAVGKQTISAAYAGDGNFSASSGSAVETVTNPVPPTPTPTPTGTPRPSGSPTPAPTPSPSPKTVSSRSPSALVIPPVTASPPTRPTGATGSAPNPDQYDTSAVPPIDLISLVSGIHMGSAPQIIVFLLVLNAVLIGAIAVIFRRGRNLTRRTLEWAGPPRERIGGDSR